MTIQKTKLINRIKLLLFAWTVIFVIYELKKSESQTLKYSSLSQSNILNSKLNFNKKLNSYNIFFIESNLNRSKFSTKQICAIESAAKHNPNASIKVYTLGAQLNSNYLLENYPNIQVINFIPEEVLNDTKLIKFWLKGDVIRSKYGYSHLSDFLRAILIWKFGGIYLDLDMITLKSFQPLIDINKNGFGYLFENYDNLNGAVMLFTRKKHPYLKSLIESFMKTYSPNSWARNGPVLIKKTILKFCKIKNYLDLELFGFKPHAFSKNRSHPCIDLTLFPESYFYPLTYVRGKEHFEIFKPGSSGNLLAKVRDSYAFHFYNRLSSKLTPRIDDGSFFSSIAEVNCNETFMFVSKNDYRFT